MAIAIDLLAIPFVYFLFCVLAADHQGRAHYYMAEGGQLYGPSTRPDLDFKLFGLGAWIPTALLVLTASYNRRYCSFEADLLSTQTLFAALTVYLIGKVFNGPSAEVRKSMLLLEDGSTRRPLWFWITDALLVIPGNLLRGWFWKIPSLVVLGILYILHISSHSSLFYYFSFGVIFVWFIGCLGRLASIIVHRGYDWKWHPVLYISMTIASAIVWDLLETSLKGCNVMPGSLPSYFDFARDLW